MMTENTQVKCRDVFKILSKIYDRTFCKDSKQLTAVNYFQKKFHYRYLTGLMETL